MISNKLQQKIKIFETLMFSEWLKADKKEREKICKKLGKIEGKLIIEEIKNQVKN